MSEQPRRYFVGLDLGQAQDFTALAVLDRPVTHPTAPPEQRRPAYALRHLQRFPLGTPYPDVVRAVVGLLRTPPLPGCLLAVDQTGVGRAVVEMLADGLRSRATCRMVAITITGGHAVTHGEDHSLHVPKKELVGTLQVLLQTRRLQVARTLPDAPALVRELENFRVKITPALNETFEPWRDGQHDDLVLAVALAAWVGEKGLPAEGLVPLVGGERGPAPPYADGRGIR
jgi:hypothetical protein